jgi:glycerophosphoryl diester phosphodiesterase
MKQYLRVRKTEIQGEDNRFMAYLDPFKKSFFHSTLSSHFKGYSLIAHVNALALVFAASSTFAFDLQGHRGARGLEPENTLPAFEKALAVGVTTLELDVGVTADGVVVVGHDPALNPNITRDETGQWLAVPAGGKGPLIKSLTLAQLQSYDVGRIKPDSAYAKQFASQQPHDGTRMPTLAALFERARALKADTVRFNIETKINPQQADDTVPPEAFVQALLKVIYAANMTSRVTIQSFDWRTLQLAQKLAPTIPTVYLSFQTATIDTLKDGVWTAGFLLAEHGGSVARMVKAAGGAVWSPNGAALTQALVKDAQALGLQVIPWTVNNASDMQRFMDWGVDGLITDYPDALRAQMALRKMALPPPVQ